MKIVLAVFAVALAFGASSAEAGKPKFPKAIDSPVVRPKVKESHKPGSRVKHLQHGAASLESLSPVERA